MGGSTSVENNTEVIHDIITKVVLKSFNKCQNDLTGVQIVDLECNPSPEEISLAKNSQACIEGTKILREQGSIAPEPSCFACVQSDLTQESILQFDAKCQGQTLNHSEIRNDIANALNDQAELSVKGFQTPLSSTESKNISNMITKVANTFTNEVINESLSSLAMSQIITQKGSGGLQSFITQQSAARMLSNTMFTNENINTAIAELATESTKFAKLEQTGPIAAIAEQIQTMVSNVADAFANIIGSPIRIIMLIVGIIIILFVIGALMSMVRKQQKTGSTNGQSGKSGSSGKGRIGFLGKLFSKKKK